MDRVPVSVSLCLRMCLRMCWHDGVPVMLTPVPPCCVYLLLVSLQSRLQAKSSELQGLSGREDELKERLNDLNAFVEVRGAGVGTMCVCGGGGVDGTGWGGGWWWEVKAGGSAGCGLMGS
jgi:hypothetical protein